MPTRKVTLDPSDSQEVIFSYIPAVAKIYYVAIDGLSGTFEAIKLAFDPWSYDVNGDGIIDIHELLPAISDYIAGKIPIDQLLQVINIYTTEPVTPPPTFDPWIYDIDASGYIETGELLDAVNDYIGGSIDIDSLLEVINLWVGDIYRW